MATSELLQRAVDALQLVDISLSKVTSTLADNVFPSISIPASVRFELKRPRTVTIQPFESNSATRRIQFHVESAIRLFRPGEGDLSKIDEKDRMELLIATIEADFIATYDEGEAAEPLPEAAISAFGTQNVPFNIWPYWREIVHALCSRMGLPKVVLPLYRMKKAQPKAPAAISVDEKDAASQKN